ncbi:hypothetical protein [Marinicrinis lubricantis]|uniref:Uncharacterized protein n=1 Tax=Marinicrinis lubricantis TaxID=2086470 RepID=A0ABW1IL32_9BACL
MTFKPSIKEVELVDRNLEKEIYQFVVTMQHQTKCRVVFTKDTHDQLTISELSRLPNVPCPICRNDYTCHCLSRFKDTLEREILARNLIPTA